MKKKKSVAKRLKVFLPFYVLNDGHKKCVWFKELHDRARSLLHFHFKVFLFPTVNFQSKGRIFVDIAKIQAESQAVLDSIMKRDFQHRDKR